MACLRAIDAWGARNAAGAVVRADGVVLETHGPARHRFAVASLTKMFAALAVLVAVEEGTVDLDDAAGPPGSTVRHLLAHASGLAFDTDEVVSEPGRRRIYSNTGFEVLAEHLARRAAMPFVDYLRDAVLGPLRLGATLDGSPAAGLTASLDDVVAFVRELQAPALVSRDTLATATAVAFPGLAGVLPGFGPQRSNDWGLGFEIRDHKSPHWTGAGNDPSSFGHFGGSGSFVWVDPVRGLALVCLTDLTFGPWAVAEWHGLSDSVLTNWVNSPS